MNFFESHGELKPVNRTLSDKTNVMNDNIKMMCQVFDNTTNKPVENVIIKKVIIDEDIYSDEDMEEMERMERVNEDVRDEIIEIKKIKHNPIKEVQKEEPKEEVKTLGIRDVAQQYYNNFGFVSLPIDNQKKAICKWGDINKDNFMEKINDNNNIGVLTGKISGITVIDVDFKNNGLKTWKRLLKKHNDGFPYQTPSVKTINGGLHVYCRYDEKITTSTNVITYKGNVCGVDTRSQSGYVVCPPSMGGQYEWIIPPTEPILEIPKWFYTYYNKSKNIKDRKIEEKREQDEKGRCDEVIKNDDNAKIPDSKRNIETTIKIIGLLNEKQSDDYTTWCHVMMGIKNSFRGKDKMDMLFDALDRFSQLSKKYDDREELLKKFNTFHQNYKNGITLNTIYAYGKIANEKEYLKIMNGSIDDVVEDEDLNKLIMETIKDKGSHASICDLMDYKYRNIHAPTENRETWYSYSFAEHKWKKHGGIYDDFLQLLKYYDNLIEQNQNNNELIKTCKIVQDKIKNVDFRDKVLKVLNKRALVRMPDFEETLNKNPYLIGFNNGVYDLQEHKFRDGKPEDYISIGVNYDYIHEHTKHLNTLNKFIEDIMPDEKERKYMMLAFSMCLLGLNNEELMHVLSGVGRNGKTKISKLLKHSFGDYYGEMMATQLTKEQPTAQNPRPDLISLKGKRIIVASEPEGENNKMNSSFIKLLTGGEGLSCRQLYSPDVKNIDPCFNMFLLCNEMPSLDKNDFAIWSRFRCLEFKTVFVDTPINQGEKKKDIHINEKLPDWKQDMMLMLIEYYKIYQTEKLCPTEEILKYTKQIRADTDIFQQYFNDCVIGSEGEKVTTQDLYDVFKWWHKKNCPYTAISSFQKFSKSLNNLGYKTEVLKIDGRSPRGIKNFVLNPEIKKITDDEGLTKKVFETKKH